MKKCMLPILALILVAAPWTGTRGQTQGEMNQGAAGEFRAADEELNSVYLTRRSSPISKKRSVVGSPSAMRR